jgi:hypothetical protein
LHTPTTPEILIALTEAAPPTLRAWLQAHRAAVAGAVNHAHRDVREGQLDHLFGKDQVRAMLSYSEVGDEIEARRSGRQHYDPNDPREALILAAVDAYVPGPRGGAGSIRVPTRNTVLAERIAQGLDILSSQVGARLMLQRRVSPEERQHARRAARGLMAAAAHVREVAAHVATRDAPAPAVPRGRNPQCVTVAPLYDSEGRKYRVEYKVVDTDAHGAGPLTTSNRPGTFEVDPAYPPEFQARDLSSLPETQKIRKIANSLDPIRVLWAHSDPTLGAPVVWRDPRTNRLHVLGGNGRTIAILMSPKDRYEDYLATLHNEWASLAPADDPRSGRRYLLVREVSRADGRPLSIGEATMLAGASQESTAAAETPLGRAMSVVRGLGITDPRVLPAFQWDSELNIDNVKSDNPNRWLGFIDVNPGFWNALLERMDPARRDAYSQAHKQVELIKQVMVGYLPREVRAQGFGDEAIEETLMAALPLIVSLETLILAGDVKPKWSLMAVLPDAIRLYRGLERMPRKERPSKKMMHTLLEQEAAQTSIAGAEPLLANIHLLGFYLGVGLANWSTLSDPSTGVQKVLKPYFSQAIQDNPKQAGMFGGAPEPDLGGGMFGGGGLLGASSEIEPAAYLASLLGVRIPRRLPEGVRRNGRGGRR